MNSEQFKIAYEGGAEEAYRNKYFNNEEEGIYRSVASGVPLFSSKDKINAEDNQLCKGFPNFTNLLPEAQIQTYQEDDDSVTQLRVRKDHVHLGY